MCNWYIPSNYGNKRLFIAILSVDISTTVVVWLVNLSPDTKIMSSNAG